MTRLLLFGLGGAVSIGFVVLGLRALYELRRHPDRSRRYLGDGLLLLAIVATAAQGELAAPSLEVPLGTVALISLMGSGWALFLFRDTFIPIRRRTKVAVGVGLAAITVVGAVAPLLGDPLRSFQPLQAFANIAPLLAWLALLVESMFRLWLSARSRPAVQRSRLQALAIGYGALVMIMVLSLTGGAQMTTPGGQRVVALMYGSALAALPFLSVAFWPPGWLRTFWRRREEISFRQALQGLLLSDTREEASMAAVEWGMRLVGAAGGVLIVNGEPLASAGLSPEEIEAIRGELASGAAPDRGRIALRLGVKDTPATLVLLPGKFTPIFAADEVERLNEFAIAATAALDRFRLISELTRVGAAKTDFLSQMSHELRTPLNSILGFSQLLSEQLEDAKQARWANNIGQAGTHLLSLINEILDLSRIEAGKLTMSPEPVSVLNSVRQSVELVAPLADAAKVTILVDEASCESYVTADASRFGQVLLNLLSNAVKYNRVSGQVRIHAVPEGENRLRIHIADTGMGIEDALRDLVFQPFERLRAAATAVEGTGIGLSISRALVELMGGTLDFASEPGVGSDFWIELATAEPLRSSLPVLSVVERPAADLDRDGLVALYIEDNPANLELISEIIGQLHGVRLEVATTATTGLDKARRTRPDLIFLDLHLPDLPGLEVLRRLQLDKVTTDIPVVVVSADAAAQQTRLLLAAGAQDYLTKPLDVSQIVRIIDAAARAKARNSVVTEPVASIA